MKLAEIKGFLTDTANSLEHPSVASVKAIIDEVANAQGTTVRMFEVHDGTMVVGFADDKALAALAAEFAQEKDVKVSEISLVSYQRERNRKAQERINKTRETRGKNKSQ